MLQEDGFAKVALLDPYRQVVRCPERRHGPGIRKHQFAQALRGRRIVIDPGHPPAGATGPTGLYEGDANLAISLPLAEKLRAAGAEVILTRTGREAPFSTTTAEDLRGRVALAVRSDAEILVSVHNNAFGEAQNPFRAYHTAVYHFQPFARSLAQALAAHVRSQPHRLTRMMISMTAIPSRISRI